MVSDEINRHGGAAAYQAQGFEVGLHITTNCADYTPTSLATGTGANLA